MKRQFKPSLFVTFLLYVLISPIFAAGTQSDYDRAEQLANTFRNKVYRTNIEPHFQADNKTFWYQIQTAKDSYEFILVNTNSGIRQPAFDHQKLAKALIDNSVNKANAKSLQIDNLEFNNDYSQLTFDGYGKSWQCDLTTYELTDIADRPAQSLPAYKPNNAPRPPQSNGKQTLITFINDTNKTVEIFWLNTNNNKRSYGKIAPQQRHIQNTYAGHVWLVCSLDSTPIATYQAINKKCKAIIGIETVQYQPPRPFRRRNRNANRSPDGKTQAFIKDNNLWLRDIATKEEIALSTNGTSENTYTRHIVWSPDSKKIIAIQTKKAPEHIVYMIESSPKDQLQPKLHSMNYHKPGDVLDIDQPRLFDVPSKKQIPIDNALFDNPWSISNFRWDNDSSRFIFLYNQRGHKILRLISIDSQTGQAQTVFEETSKTFIDYSGKMFYRYIENTDEIIWMSERDGWNHLYLFDAITGNLKNQITKGQWVIRSVENVDTDTRQIWFTAGGIHPDQDPYYIHYGRINFDGTNQTILTQGDGTHELTYSPDRTCFIDKYSRIDMPPVHELRKTEDGSLICQLEKADWSELLKTGWQIPERFVARGRDGTTDIYGMIIRPTNFDPDKTYPIIENIYAGPQSAFVPKSFRSYYGFNKLAELGFIIVKMDGMGTSQRSKAFHDVCWKNLADAGFPDRILWIKAASKKYPYMDTTHIGIYGGSAGGQNAATAVMTHGDFYKVAVADCGCHDNRMDKVWWNEQWMGWPVGPHYQANSNVTLAPNLQGHLLLTVGELDKNVDPASTMQVVNALIKANKDFDMLIIPGAGHGAGESRYASRRRADYFVRHLLHVEPRSTQ